jgi:hypothetical protein
MTECYETKVGSHSVKCKKYKHQVQLILELMMKSKYLSTYLPTYVDR